ncbi:uncharacterized protein [Rutidosis leptorrhynchoides]|uniref:uncharacterized protein isoform X2 n=1 Tax=Rutidosis leptorrhynchoides TaxID=125765 RepID=UPI003A995A76
MKHSWMLVIILVAIAIVILDTAHAAPTAAQCKEERRLAVNACKTVLYGRRPSSYCCQRARVSHVECICPAITPKLAALVDVNHFVKLIEGCGRRVPRHFKCGSITTP